MRWDVQRSFSAIVNLREIKLDSVAVKFPLVTGVSQLFGSFRYELLIDYRYFS